MIAAEGKMEQIVINEKISYIECSENPLSADIGIIREGDTLYSKARDGYYVFNAQLVKEEIAVLKGLKAPYLLVSHYKGLPGLSAVLHFGKKYVERFKTELSVDEALCCLRNMVCSPVLHVGKLSS